MKTASFIVLFLLILVSEVLPERQDIDCTIQPLQGETWLRTAAFGPREMLNIDCRRVSPDPKETKAEPRWMLRDPERDEKPKAPRDAEQRKCTCNCCKCR